MRHLEQKTIERIQETKDKRIKLIELLEDNEPKKKPKKKPKTQQKKAS